jgi:hypothetical protein
LALATTITLLANARHARLPPFAATKQHVQKPFPTTHSVGMQQIKLPQKLPTKQNVINPRGQHAYGHYQAQTVPCALSHHLKLVNIRRCCDCIPNTTGTSVVMQEAADIQLQS